MNSIVCENLSKTYVDGPIRVEVFKNLNFTVATGEVVGIIGASGVGKSTLLQLMGGLDKANDGRVIIAEQNMMELNEREKGRLRNRYLGFVYQFHHLLPEFNALENVAMPLLIRGMKSGNAIERARNFIERVGLQERLQHRIGELSGGERQRIAIARALVTDPKCVLADEPTGNLDQTTAEHVYQLMMRLNKELGTSFVIVTHNERMTLHMDRVMKLEAGVLQETTPA